MMRIENPSWLMLPASGGLSRPPTRTRLQLLPFGELEWENFERLCYRLAKAGGDVEQWAALYGSRGQKQHGIDIYVRRPNAKLYSCWQSKRHKKLTPAVLKTAIAEFEKGEWVSKSDELIVCTAASIQDTKLQSEVETQTTRLQGKNLKLRVLGQTELSTELKDHSKLVRDFFGREWVRAFCADGDETVGTLDVTDIATIRAELRKHYVSNFSSIDPGILSGNIGKSDSSRLLPILDRFVEPDIEVSESSSMASEPTKAAEPIAAAHSDLSQVNIVQNRSPLPLRELVRRRVSSWVAEDDYTIIVGDAGFGKSTALRVFALDMLNDGTRFPSVAQRWADCIPIVMPFAFWARLVEKDEIKVSLANAVEIWFKKFDISEALLALILRSLEEQKTLLLIDGLDEWSNESAARSTLALLTTFIKTKGVPAILTGRPGGLARLGALDPVWRQARLAALSDQQQRMLATIWFDHVHSTEGGAQSAGIREQQVKTQVGNFFGDLAQGGTLLTLSSVPLLLSGLISLYLRQVSLPRSRFQAYEELIQLLLEIHPSRRALAALDRSPRFVMLADAALRKQTLAHLAYHKRLQGYDAGCPVAEARTIIVGYLQSLDGAGLPPRDAIAGAKELLSVDADTAGLVVEKAPEEIGFVHAVFEEALVGSHLAGWRLQDQEDFIKANDGNPRWATSILAMLHALTRPSDIDVLVRAMASPELAAAADVVRQTLIAQVIFGDFRCSPRLAAELTPGFVRIVTTETWFPHREALLRLILESAVSSSARESIRDKPHEWFPDPSMSRERIYPALKHWPKDATLLELLWLGLFNDRSENKRAAATTLAALFDGDVAVGDRLYALCLSVADGETLCAALEALMQGWWDYERLKDLIAAARVSAYPNLRLVSIRARIKALLQDGDDLKELLAIAEGDLHAMGPTHPMIFQALAAGWPNDPKIIAAAITGASMRGPRGGMGQATAKAYLLHFAQTNSELDTKVAEMIREDEHFFSMSFGVGYTKGKYGPSVLAALDFRLDRMNRHLANNIAHIAIMSRSAHAKQVLIGMLADDQWIFWPVYGLLVGWGMKDEETSVALLAVAAGSPEKLQFLAHHLPEIIQDKAACRAKLLEIARLERIERLDFLLAGFNRLGITPDDTEVLNLVLRHDFSGRGVRDATTDLISTFGGHPAVRSIALNRLKELDAPWEALTKAYAGDREIRAIIARSLASLPVALRSVLVSALGRRAADDTTLKDHLLQYRLDSNAGVRTASAIAYYEAVGNDTELRATALDTLRQDAAAIGPWMDIVRQAALAGFIALDEVAEFREVPDIFPDKKASLDIFDFSGNRQIVTYVAKHWERLKAALGSDLFERLSRHASSEWWCWDQLAPYISESVLLRSDFLAYCARETKPLSSRVIEALAREAPRSHLLRERCLRYFVRAPEDINVSPYEYRRRELIVGRILGRQFGGDEAIRETLESHVQFPSASIVGLSIAWKDSPKLVVEFEALRASDGRASHLVWPDVAYLASTLGSRDEFCRFVSRFLESSDGSIWNFLSFCVEPIVERIKSEDGLAEHLIARVKVTDRGSEKASLPKLLAMANAMNDDLRQWCEKQFASQSNHTALAEFGLDVLTGEIRPVAHAILDALSPNRY